jgi:hypothetical protein
MDFEELNHLICFVGNVKIDCCAAGLVSMKDTEWRGIYVKRDEVALTHVWIAELMDVGNI